MTKTVNTYVGSPIERLEDLRLLRGKGKFVDDIQVDDLLYAAVVRSSVAHGRLLSVDISSAREVPGVVAIITSDHFGEDIPLIPIRLFSTPELLPYRQPVLARHKVRYVGEPIAFIVAESPAIPEDAADFVVVDIEPIQAVADIGLADLDALEASAVETELFAGNRTNRAITYTNTKGAVDDAFSAADRTHRESFYVHRHTGITMETRGVLAEWSPERQHMTVSGAAKVPYPNKRILAKLLDLPDAAVDMIEGDAGGSFGVRGEFFPEDFLVPYAARMLERPVKWIEDRREHFLAVSHARDARCDIEIACKDDGTILGVRGTIRSDIGAYMRTTGTIGPRNLGQFFTGPYRIPNVRVEVHVELSNKSPSATYRGPGRFETDFFRERLFDIVAAQLGIDRVEFRRRNLVDSSEMPYAFPSIEPNPSNTALDSGKYKVLLDFCLKKANWTEKRAIQGKLIDGRYHGLGVVCFIEGGAAGPSENAKIEIGADGMVNVHVGSSTVGQGVETTLSQIAADAMEVPMERIRLGHGSTPHIKDGWGSYHSRSTVMGGSAILLCANDLKPLIRKAGAAALGVASETVSYNGGLISSADGRSVSLKELDCAELTIERTFFNSKHTYSYGTHVAHVAVDIKTGHVEVIDYIACEDPGVAVNPLTLHGQAIGAIVQGLGGTFLEHLIYDESGQMLTASFADYLMPLATDYPNIRAYSMPMCPSPNNPLGVKGAGEGGVIPVGGVIANAVANALQDFNVQPKTLPLSPQNVWRLIKKCESDEVKGAH